MNDLINVGLATVRVDQSLTFSEMFSLARRLRNLDANTMDSFFIQGRFTVIGRASVILPDVTSHYNQTVLDLFRGKARLAEVPDPNAETTTQAPRGGTGQTTTSTTAASDASTTVPVSTVPTTISPSITPVPDSTCH